MNQGVQKKYYDQRSAAYDRDFFTPTPTAARKRFNKLIPPDLNQTDFQTILEVGAGTGGYTRLLKKLPHHQMVVSELSFNMLTILKGKEQPPNRSAYLAADAAGLPFFDETFDNVFAFACFHHISDTAGAFKEIYRILKPKGRFFLMEPNPAFPLNSLMGILKKHERGMVSSWPAKWKAQASSAGFHCTRAAFGSFFPGKPSWMEPVYQAVEPVMEKMPVIRNMAIFCFFTFEK